MALVSRYGHGSRDIRRSEQTSINFLIDFPLFRTLLAFASTMISAEKSGALASVKHVILVLSGKGGVGKSTVAVQLAAALRLAGQKVGLLDIDLCGPSIPRMLHLEGQSVHQCPEGWVPVYTDESQTLSVMSIGFLLENRDQAVIWRGPKKSAMIRQFLTDVCWSDIDYLVIDTPPGTSDEHIAVVDNLKRYRPDGAILVTTPQAVAVGDVRREATFCKKTGIPILGIVENMSGFVCPTCQECTLIFSKGGGQALANYCEVPFLGNIPIDPQLANCAENGLNYLEQFPSSAASNAFKEIVEKLLADSKGLIPPDVDDVT